LAARVNIAARGELTTTVAGSNPLKQSGDAQRVSKAGHPAGTLILIAS
jgi:hypothetical protein